MASKIPGQQTIRRLYNIISIWKIKRRRRYEGEKNKTTAEERERESRQQRKWTHKTTLFLLCLMVYFLFSSEGRRNKGETREKEGAGVYIGYVYTPAVYYVYDWHLYPHSFCLHIFLAAVRIFKYFFFSFSPHCENVGPLFRFLGSSGKRNSKNQQISRLLSCI